MSLNLFTGLICSCRPRADSLQVSCASKRSEIGVLLLSDDLDCCRLWSLRLGGLQHCNSYRSSWIFSWEGMCVSPALWSPGRAAVFCRFQASHCSCCTCESGKYQLGQFDCDYWLNRLMPTKVHTIRLAHGARKMCVCCRNALPGFFRWWTVEFFGRSERSWGITGGLVIYEIGDG